MRKIFFLGAAILAFSNGAYALDKDDADALADTQKLLHDQDALNAAAKDNKDATGALDQVNQMTAGNTKQKAEVNDISSTVFSDMVKNTNGDPAAMQEKLQQALKDPGAFLKSLPPEQQARIRGLASEMDKQNAQPAAPAATK
ncbi:MAG: hypothetical protein ACXWSD_02865 [Bdellovibrionota bacterium]